MPSTVFHKIAQYIKSIIRVYLDTSFMFKFGDELMVDLENLKLEQGQLLASLDVVKLFMKKQ